MTDASTAPDCIFCKIVAGELPSERVHETATTVAFKDINPAAPLHVLVVPRRHIVDASTVSAADGSLLADLLLAARAVADDAGLVTPERGYRLVFNIGPDALNSVPHLHLHVLGGEPLRGHLNAT
jgi:histidine triad (HIT) family protein